MKRIVIFFLITTLSLGGLFGGIGWADKDLDLLDAAIKGNISRLRELIKAGADVNTKDKKFGLTTLMMAASEGHADVVRELIKAGADLNAKGNLGFTALMYAALKGHADVARELIAAGADLNTKDNKLVQTALM